MKRKDWEFDYTASRLAEAAKTKTSTHTTKKVWWEKKKAEVMALVREKGIDIQDSVAASYSNTKGSFGPQITIDESLQRDLLECQTKILEHDRLVREYDGWRQVLEANSESRMKLNHEDWLYFFGE